MIWTMGQHAPKRGSIPQLINRYSEKYMKIRFENLREASTGEVVEIEVPNEIAMSLEHARTTRRIRRAAIDCARRWKRMKEERENGQ